MRAVALALVVLAAAASVAASDCAESSTERTVTMRFSRFEPAAATVPAGVAVTFTLRNDDPIEHEWIVGTDDVHARHRTGTEPYHDEIPTEVTVPALSSRVTTVTFEHAGLYRYVCHLPGHEAYGMVGTVRVVE
ncbi:MAG TPA: cupredoxin domain-containing protein [Dehalococcoidia bacterium]|nr:cupredoxin domain-containing protein [Dehalococcoidia bacterium]